MYTCFYFNTDIYVGSASVKNEEFWCRRQILNPNTNHGYIGLDCGPCSKPPFALHVKYFLMPFFLSLFDLTPGVTLGLAM